MAIFGVLLFRFPLTLVAHAKIPGKHRLLKWIASKEILWYGMTSHWDEVSFVLASTYRETILERLMTGPATPSQLATETGHSISHVSRALSELREEELVELLVSDDRKKGRVYGITEQGNEIWETIDAENLA